MFYNCFLCSYHFTNKDYVLIADCGHFCCEKCAPDVTWVVGQNIKKDIKCKCEENFIILKENQPVSFEKAVALQTNILLTKLIYETFHGQRDTSIALNSIKDVVSKIDYNINRTLEDAKEKNKNLQEKVK